MTLSIQERIELSSFLRFYNSDKTDEIVTAKSIFDKVKVDEKKFEVVPLQNGGYHIGLQQDNDFEFTNDELMLLKNVHKILETNSRVNMDNLSLCLKLREIKTA